MNNGMEKEIFEIYLEDIIPNRFQPRLYFDEKGLHDLAESIRLHGIIQPLVLRKVGDKYEIIAGERRYKAAGMAGLKKVPAVLVNLDDNESAEVAIVENIQRRDLTPLEEAKSYKKLLDRKYLTQEQLAARMGKSQSSISNKLRLLTLDEEVQNALLNERISERHARSLLSVKNPYDQKEILNKIIENRLTVRQTDDLIKKITGNSSNNEEEQNDNNQIIKDIPTNVNAVPEPVILPQNILNQSEEINPMNNIEKPNNFVQPGGQEADISQEKEQPDLLKLLNINNSQPDQSNEAEVETIDVPEKQTSEEVNQNKFISNVDIEDEETNMSMGDILSAPNTDTSFNFDQNQNLVNNPVDTGNFQPSVGVPGMDNIDQPSNFGNNVQENPTLPEVNNIQQPSFVPSNNIEAGDLKSAIAVVRDTVKDLEGNGFGIDTEEFDFENLYQIIIKINKK